MTDYDYLIKYMRQIVQLADKGDDNWRMEAWTMKGKWDKMEEEDMWADE